MSDYFDYEQQILKCWNVTDDIKEVSEAITELDLLSIDDTTNALNGLAAMYELKFNKLWALYEGPIMDIVRENKMLNEELAAMIQQQHNGCDEYGCGGKTSNQGAGRPSLFGIETENFKPVPIIKGSKK